MKIDTIMLFIFYDSKLIFLIDDEKQLSPIIYSGPRDSNVFANQFYYSLFSGFKYADYFCYILNENRRISESIAQLIAKIFYHIKKLDYIIFSILYPLDVTQVLAFNKNKYECLSLFLGLDISSDKAIREEEDRRSSYNIENAAVTINLVQDLLEMNVAETGKDIIVLTSYDLDCRFQRIAFDQLRQAQLQLPLDGITVVKIDGFQDGKENIVIVSWITDRKLGFLRIMNRLNVGVSRS